MSSEPITVLLVEDDPSFARLITTALRRAPGRRYELTHVELLSDALTTLKQRNFHAVLLDLSLPDAQGLDTFNRLSKAAESTSVLILSGLNDETIALNAVQAGAQDYLVKGQIDIRGLTQAITYAIERQRLQADRNRHIMQLAILRDVDEELTRRLDLGYVLTMALDTAVRLSVASAGMIGLLEAGKLQQARYINFDPRKIKEGSIFEHGVIGRCLRERQAQRVLDVALDSDYIPVLPNMRAQIAIPLISQDRLIGFLDLETSRPARFTEETFDFLKLLAARIAAAVDNARLYEMSQRQLNELQELYNQVRSLEQTKTDMIRIATHDLRTPINNILGFTHLLRRVVDLESNPQAVEFLEYIEQAGRRMEQITQDILSLERLGEGGELQTELVDLPDLVEKAYQEYQAQAHQKNQQFALNVSSRPVSVRAEPALLYEAVVNLVANAIKYTPEGGTIQLNLARNGEVAIFEVKDTGYGIPEEQQKRLFQPFFRAHSKEVEDIEGTGLGLHLARNIILRHDGEMRFSSVYGSGSTFGFELPLA